MLAQASGPGRGPAEGWLSEPPTPPALQAGSLPLPGQRTCLAERGTNQLMGGIFKPEKGKRRLGASLVVWWLRISLALQGILVQSLVWGDPHAATKPMSHNYCASHLEPDDLKLAHTLQLLKPEHCRAHDPQQERPLQ